MTKINIVSTYNNHRTQFSALDKSDGHEDGIADLSAISDPNLKSCDADQNGISLDEYINCYEQNTTGYALSVFVKKMGEAKIPQVQQEAILLKCQDNETSLITLAEALKAYNPKHLTKALNILIPILRLLSTKEFLSFLCNFEYYTDGSSSAKQRESFPIQSNIQLTIFRQLALKIDTPFLIKVLEKTGEISNYCQVEAFVALMLQFPPIINSIDEVDSWIASLSQIRGEPQGTIMAELISRGVIKKPEDITLLGNIWSTPPIFLRAATTASQTITLNPEENILFLEARENIDISIQSFLDFVSDVTTQTRLEPSTNSRVSWQNIYSSLCKQDPILDEEVTSLLSKQIDMAQDDEQVMHILSSVPTRRIFNELLINDLNGKIQTALHNKWQSIGDNLGQIVFGNDKEEYLAILERNLEEQNLGLSSNITSNNFYVPVMTIDLNNLHRSVLQAQINIIDEHRVLILVRGEDDSLFAGIFNPEDISTIKHFFRQLCPGKDHYMLYYYPKLQYTPNGWEISSQYEQIDTFYENVVGKNTPGENFVRANERFKLAYAQEDEFRVQARFDYARLISDELRQKIMAEPPLNPEEVYSLMKTMRVTSCDKQVTEVFNLTNDEYQKYNARVQAILEEKGKYTREEFMVKAIEACDGRVALASVLSYNILFKMGEICSNSLFISYPDSFASIEDVQDQAGSIYHYFGCFFAAYSLQRWLIDRYSNDKIFADHVKQDSSSRNFDILAFNTEVTEQLFDNLLNIQYYYLKLGSSKSKEIMSITGVYYEEVVSDKDITWEVRADFMGIAGGQALYEVLSGNTLSNNTDFSRDSGLRNLYVMGLTSGAERLLNNPQ